MVAGTRRARTAFTVWLQARGKSRRACAERNDRQMLLAVLEFHNQVERLSAFALDERHGFGAS